MKRSILILIALLLCTASFGNNYSAEFQQIDTLRSQRMNRDAIDLTKRIYDRAAKDGDRSTQLLALSKGIITELELDHSAKDLLIDSLRNMRSEFRDDAVNCALLNSFAFEFSILMWRDDRVMDIRADIVEETLSQREMLSTVAATPDSPYITFIKDKKITSTTLYIELLRNYLSMPTFAFQNPKQTKRIYEELISLPEMSDELQVSVQLDYIQFMSEDVTERLKELEAEYSHCDAVVMVSANLIERELRAERYKAVELQDFERIEKMCRDIKQRYPNSKQLNLIDDIIANLHGQSGSISLPKQIYPNVETKVAIEVRNTERLSVEVYKLSGEISQNEELAGVAIYNKNRNEKLDSLAMQSELIQTQKLSFKPRLNQNHKSTFPLTIKAYGRYLAVVRDDEGRVLSGEVTSVSKIGATTSITQDKLLAYVVDFNTGAPLKRASFDLYIGDKYLFTRKLESEDGCYTIAERSDLKSGTFYTIKVDDGAGDTLSISNRNYNGSRQSTSDKYSITSYTDRGAYRPGDTVRIHSVIYSPSRRVVEGLHVCNRVDYGSGEILNFDHTKTDHWGGASSSIAIPKDVPSGQYRIYTFSNSKDANNFQIANSTQKYIRIESYTQPTSEITLEQVKPIYLPKERVQLSGQVTGYDGRNMEGVKVEYEVKQSVSYSYYEYETIEQRSVTTDSNGEYNIEFLAAKAGYEINARMVDKNGESREVSRKLYVRESPYSLESLMPYAIPRSLDLPFTFSRDIESKEPFVWSYTISKDGDEKALLSGEFKDNEPLKIPYEKLPNGVYVIRWRSPQGVGDDGSHRFLIYDDATSKTPANDDILFVDAPQREVTAGDPLRYIVSTTEREIYALVTLSCGDSILHSQVMRLSRGTHEFAIDYAATATQDVVLNISTTKGGKRYNENQIYNIVNPSEAIEVKIEGLAKELKASTENELRVKVCEQGTKQAVQSKLIVTIYDKASEQIEPNTLPTLKNKASSWGYISRSAEPYSFNFLRFDFSRGNEKIMIRGLAKSADYEDNMVSVGYGASAQRDITGAVGSNAKSDSNVRDDFSQTALFSGEIITDESGEAVIPFTLSDLLTTYCVKVVAVTLDARSAATESEFVATKKVMVTTLLPQFIRLGDMLKFKTLATNRHDYPIEATIKMEYFDTRTKTIFNKGLRSVQLPANSSQSLEWEITAPDYVEELGVKVSLNSEDDNDTEQHTLAVDPAVERIKLGRINYLDGKDQTTYIKPKTLLQDGAFNENMTLSYEAITPILIRTIAAQRERKPTTAVDFANRIYTTQATHTLAQRYSLTTIERARDQEVANLPNSEWWLDNLIDMRDHTKAHTKAWQDRYRLEEFRQSDGGYSWLRGGKSSLTTTLYIARTQLNESVIKCKSFTSNNVDKALNRTLEYLDKEMAKDSITLSRSTLEYLELRSRTIKNSESPTPKWSSYLDKIESEWRTLNTYQMAQAALVLHRSGRDNSEMIKLIKQQAVGYPTEGVTFPSGYADNFSTIVEGNIAAHTLIMTLLKSTNKDDYLLKEMFRWLIIQRKNQVWVNSATTLEVISAMYDILYSGIFKDQNRCRISYPHNMVKSRILTSSHLDIDIVREGRAIVVNQDAANSGRDKYPVFTTLDYSYDVALKDIAANSSGLTVSRELLTSYYPKIGDIVRVRYTIKSDHNINMVKLRTMKSGAYEPRDLKSSYKNGYYREVRSDCINYYFDLIERGTTTIEEEYMVWYSGDFADGYAVVESITNPHLSGNTAVERIKVE